MSATTEMKTLTCPGPPEHEFQIPKGRGRPPKYCDKHKSQQGDQKVSDTETRARPRPGSKPEPNGDVPRPRPRAPRVNPPDKGPLDEPTPVSDDSPQPDAGLRRIPPPRGDRGSRGKSENAADRAVAATESDFVWPRSPSGRPMARIEFQASELIPTGQYANVTVGPGRVTVFIDLERDVDDGYFSQAERESIVMATNELAEMIEKDVIGIQRSLVLESLQADQGDK